MATHNDFGKWGEDIAEQYLINKGYYIIERDWKCGHRDIDIIAQHNDYHVFIEVKTRRNTDFGEPIEAIDYKKRNNLRSAIANYLKTHFNVINSRFDIISIVAATEHQINIQHYEDVPLL